MKTLTNLLLSTGIFLGTLAGINKNSLGQELKNALIIYVSPEKEGKYFGVDSIKPYKFSYKAPAFGLLMGALEPEEIAFDPKIRMYLGKKTEKGLNVIPATLPGWHDFSKDHSKKIQKEIYNILSRSPSSVEVSEQLSFKLSVDEKNPYSQDVKNALLAYVSADTINGQTIIKTDSIIPYKILYKTPASNKVDFDMPIRLYIIKKTKNGQHVIPTILKWGYDFSKEPKKIKKEAENILNISKEKLSISEPVKWWSPEMFFEILGDGK